jgi:hypothetical protein
MRITFTFFILLSLGFACQTAQPLVSKSTAPALNLDKPADNLAAFVKMRASLDTNEITLYYWTGTVYSYVPGERAQPLFGLEAMNIARIRKVGEDYQMLTREAAIYRDLKTGKILEKWFNPFIKDTVEVIHVWNDPVNQSYALKSRFGDWNVPYKDQGDGRVCLYSDIFLLYPSPLSPSKYPENSRSEQYQAAELFQFFIDKNTLLDPSTKNVYSEVGWTRISDFLPWMRMGSKPGNLVYQCRGHKTKGGFETLPKEFSNYILAQHPEFAAPPKTFERPNMTSWQYFKKLMEGGK